MSSLIWVQSVCIGYQQTTLGGKELALKLSRAFGDLMRCVKCSSEMASGENLDQNSEWIIRIVKGAKMLSIRSGIKPKVRENSLKIQRNLKLS